MISYSEEIVRSWVPSAPSVRGLATLLGLPTPFGLRSLIDRLRFVEHVSTDQPINTDDGAPINGHVTILLRSDGSYVFSGFMHATGAFSYHYGVQAWVNTSEGPIIAAQNVGRVFGTDTPGPRQRDWNEPGNNAGIKLHWPSIRRGAALGYHMDAEISGVLGAAEDVLLFAVRGIAATIVLGPAGWFVLIGSELADMNVKIGSPDILAGILVAGGTLLILGPYGLVPAVVAGAVAVSRADVRHRSMKPEEIAFADRVFMGKVDYSRVILTNLTHDGGRKYTIPSIDDSILVNLGDALDTPMSHAQPGTDYPEPGSVFIHELTHAWQITNRSLLGVLCGMSSNYDYFTGSRTSDKSWPGRAWSTFNNEQQAHIVDDWYGAHVVKDAMGNYVLDAGGVPITDVNGPDALNDPAYHFIRDNIRTGIV